MLASAERMLVMLPYCCSTFFPGRLYLLPVLRCMMLITVSEEGSGMEGSGLFDEFLVLVDLWYE